MNSLVVNPNDLVIADGAGPLALPAHLAGVDTGVSKALLAGMYTGGNRIGLKNSRFRLIVNGIEEGIIEDNFLDTILLDAAPAVSRVFYAGAYKQGENVPPTCYSADGIAPPLDVPQRQSDKCATCPQNVKGSKIADGQKFKACGYFRRLVLMLAGDVDDRRTFKLDAKSGSLWGDGTASAKNLNDYIKSLESRGVDVGHVVTRITFDLNASVPKLLFRAYRYITPEELDAVRSLVGSDEVRNLAEVNMNTVDLSAEEASEELPPATEEAPQTQQAAPQQAARQTATPAAQRPQTAAQRPAAQRTAAPQVEEVPADPAPARQQVQRPAQQTARPQTQQTQRPAAQTVQRPAAQQAAPQQQVPAVQEVDSDDDLSKILEGLEV